MTIFSDSTQSVGNTPLVRLNKLAPTGANILVKVEGRNPSFSVKCRLGVALIDDAERRGFLKPHGRIIEPTSGNTGIALAYVAAVRGYKVTLTMPETMSTERRKLLRYLGAEIVLTPGAEGMTGAIKKAKELYASDPTSYIPQQFDNPANAAIHEATTGPEIWADTKGGIDVLVAGVGTGGTITGIARHIKKGQKKKITVVAVEPSTSPVISQAIKGEALTPGSHSIQGIGAGFIPKVLDLSLIDKVELVTSADAVLFARKLAQLEGLLVGISSGAAAAAAIRLAALPEFTGKTIVAILPDLTERYMSTPLFEGIEA